MAKKSKPIPEFHHAAAARARREEGQDRRAIVPLESHASVPSGREDAMDIITAEDSSRLPNLVPIRHGRMSVSPFTFYRATAAVMASDLSRTPTTDLTLQICGDAHLSNFGVFSGPDRRLVFDLNDFDETLAGPFEWDVKRLAASITVAGRHNDFKEKEIRRATRSAVTAYRGGPRTAVPHRTAGAQLHQGRDRAGHPVAQGSDHAQARRQGVAEGAAARQHLGGRQAHRDRQRTTPDRVAPAADHPARRAARGHRLEGDPGLLRLVSVHAAPPPPTPAQPLRRRRRRPQDRRCRQCRHAAA